VDSLAQAQVALQWGRRAARKGLTRDPHEGATGMSARCSTDGTRLMLYSLPEVSIGLSAWWVIVLIELYQFETSLTGGLWVYVFGLVLSAWLFETSSRGRANTHTCERSIRIRDLCEVLRQVSSVVIPLFVWGFLFLSSMLCWLALCSEGSAWLTQAGFPPPSPQVAVAYSPAVLVACTLAAAVTSVVSALVVPVIPPVTLLYRALDGMLKHLDIHSRGSFWASKRRWYRGVEREIFKDDSLSDLGPEKYYTQSYLAQQSERLANVRLATLGVCLGGAFLVIHTHPLWNLSWKLSLRVIFSWVLPVLSLLRRSDLFLPHPATAAFGMIVYVLGVILQRGRGGPPAAARGHRREQQADPPRAYIAIYIFAISIFILFLLSGVNLEGNTPKYHLPPPPSQNPHSTSTYTAIHGSILLSAAGMLSSQSELLWEQDPRCDWWLPFRDRLRRSEVALTDLQAACTIVETHLHQHRALYAPPIPAFP